MPNSARVTLEIFARDLTQAAIRGVRLGVSSISSALSALAKVAASAAGGLFAFTRFAVLGERDIAVASRFRGAMDALGLSADNVRERLTAATGGLVEQNDVMAAATKSLRDGKFTLDQTALAFEFLRLKAVSTGADVTDFTKNGIDALSRGMARGLLPLFPDLNRQLEELANSGVEGASQKGAVLRLVFEQMAQTLPELRGQVGDTTTAAQQFGIALKDTLSEAASQVAAQPETQAFFQQILASVKELIARLPELLPTVLDAIRGISTLVGELAKAFVTAADGWSKLMDLVKQTPQTIEATNLAKNVAAEFGNLDQLVAGSPGWRKTRELLAQEVEGLSQALLAGGRIEGLTAEQLTALTKAFDEFGAHAEDQWGPHAQLMAKALGRRLKEEIDRNVGAIAAKAAAPAAPEKPKVEPPKVDLSNLGAGAADLGPQLRELDQALQQAKLAYEGVGPASQAYADRVLELQQALQLLTQGQELSGPIAEKVASLQNELAETAKKVAEAVRQEALAQAELDAALDANAVTLFTYDDTFANVAGTATTVAAAMDGVQQAIQRAQEAAQRADLGVGSAQDAARAAAAAQEQIRLVAAALLAAGLPADELQAKLAELTAAFQALGGTANNTLRDVSSTLKETLADAIGGVAESIGNALASAFGGFEDFGKAILAIVAQMLRALGQSLVAIGLAGIAIKQFITNPALAIAAGAALIALGAALSKAATSSVDAGGRALASGGGGVGGAPAATAQATEQAKPPLKVIVRGNVSAMDPYFVDTIAAAFSEATDRDIIVEREIRE